ncbi:MAG TPA: DoxX family protein [Terriglobales bacterium]|nr:DoxX family protein [Terriglobales bacterium]
MATTALVLAPSKRWLWTGRVLSALPVLLMVATALFGFLNPAVATAGLEKYGYPAHVAMKLCALELICAILYAIPQTAVFGAIMVTAYFGAAVATHVRVGEPFYIPVIVAIVMWIGLYLRDQRLQALVPLRK